MFCKQCGQRIADDSRFCKFCGAAQAAPSAQPSGRSEGTKLRPRWTDDNRKVVGAAIAAVVLLLFVGSIGSDPGPSTEESSLADLGVGNLEIANGQAATSRTPTDQWSYTTDVDKVRGGTTYYATTTSTNNIFQSPPYDSQTTMDLTLRKSPAFGTDVILTISSGQMMCSSYDGCDGTVRFDDGRAQKIGFNGPADNSSEVVFVVGAKSFIAKLKKAKKVVIEKTLFQAGNPQFEFDVSGLKWDH